MQNKKTGSCLEKVEPISRNASKPGSKARIKEGKWVDQTTLDRDAKVEVATSFPLY